MIPTIVKKRVIFQIDCKESLIVIILTFKEAYGMIKSNYCNSLSAEENMILLKTSIISTILAVLLLGLRMFLKNILPRQSMPVFWYIVILRSLFVFNISYTPYAMSIPVNNAIDKISGRVYSSYVGMAEKTGGGILKAINNLEMIWLFGFLIFGIFQVVLYVIYTYRFSKSISINNEHIERWQHIYCKKPVIIKGSDYICAPLTYGIIKPVILIPSSMNLNDTRKLRYIFLHEYMHICRHDVFLKILLLISLSIHWYNPMLWIVYKVVNADIEYACDEAVIKLIGDGNKKKYATLLVDMAEDSLSKFNLCNHLSNCILEKRIIEIMKERKRSVIAKPLSCILVTALVLIAAISLQYGTVLANEQIFRDFSGIENVGIYDSTEIIINTEHMEDNSKVDSQKRIRNSEGQTYNYEREMSEALGDTQQEIMDEIYLKTGVKVTPMYGNAYIKSEEEFLRD